MNTIMTRRSRIRIFSKITIILIWRITIIICGEDVSELLEISNEMRSYMNEHIDPCDNFHEFACGNWPKIHPADKVYPQSAVPDIMRKYLNMRAREVLVGGIVIEPEDTEQEIIAKKLYDTCRKLPENFGSYKAKLRELAIEFGDMPALKGDTWDETKFDWIEVTAKILHKYAIPTILIATPMQDFQNTSINRLYVGGTNFHFQSRSVYFDDATKYQRDLWKNRIKYHLISLLDMDEKLANQTAEEIANFEISLAVGLVPEDVVQEMSDLFLSTTVEKLHEKYAPNIDIKRFINITLGDHIPAYTEKMYEIAENYQKNLNQLIQQTPKRIVANYIMYKLLKTFIVVPKKTPKDQAESCYDTVQQSYTKELDSIAYRTYRSNESEHFLYSMFEELRDTFKLQLSSDTKYDWIQEKTRKYAIDKLNGIQFYISSNQYDPFAAYVRSVDTDDYLENMKAQHEYAAQKIFELLHKPSFELIDTDSQAITPQYRVKQNNITFPVAWLQPYYLWTTKAPGALKFGSIGALIGHEIVHGFDDSGRKYDKYGNEYEWLDELSLKSFEEGSKCFKEQYNSYEHNGRKLPKTIKPTENIADNGGLNLAYEAYLRWCNRSNDASCESLPKLNYTHKQLFFISFAQFWCIDVEPNYNYYLTTIDSHTPPELRVIGTLSNSKEFAKEFNCPLGSKMNPSKKCEIY